MKRIGEYGKNENNGTNGIFQTGFTGLIRIDGKDLSSTPSFSS
jgi:hypothetical protein